MPFKTDPYDYQKDVFEKSRNLSAAAYFLEQGLGKTKVTIDVASFLAAEKGLIKAVMVFAPGQIAANWALGEIKTHAWDDADHEIFRWSKPLPKTVALCKRALGQTPADGVVWWFCFNKEALLDKSLQPLLRNFMRAVPTMMVLDESTFVKSPSAKTTRQAINIGKFAACRRILTGTPQTNTPVDLYKQYQFLDERILGVTTKQGFLDHYCVVETKKFKRFDPKTRKSKLVEITEALSLRPEFYERVAPYTFRLKKDEVLKDLPPKMFTEFKIEMTPSERELYKELKDNMIADLRAIGQEKGEIKTFNKLATMIRLQQLLSGIAVTDQGTHFFESSKQKALWELIETVGDEQVIIWANFRHSIETIVKHLQSKKLKVGWLYGGMKPKQKDEFQTEFADGKLQFLVAHPITAGKGLTFTKCSRMIFYENSYSYENRVQAEDRIHRIGQKAATCQYTDMIVDGTIDERILEVLLLKQNLNDVLTREDLEQWLQ